MQAAHERDGFQGNLFWPVQESSPIFRALRQKAVDIGRLCAGQDANRTQDFDKECRIRMPTA
jgi:hypothetical protein